MMNKLSTRAGVLAGLLVTTTTALADTAPAPPPPPPYPGAPAAAPEPDRFAFQIGAGYLSGGDVYVEDFEVETSGGALATLAVDSIVSSRLSLGLFAVAAKSDVGDTGATISTVGATIKSRFGSATGTQFRVGLAFGYQRIAIDDAEGMDPIQGFDIAPVLEVAFPSSGSMSFVLQASALSQPVGGNSDVEVTFAPIAYVAALVEIH